MGRIFGGASGCCNFQRPNAPLSCHSYILTLVSPRGLLQGDKDVVDNCWLYTMLALIGEAFDDTDKVNGCVVSIRKNQSKLSLWTKCGEDDEACARIGVQLRANLELDESFRITYIPHQESIKENKEKRRDE